MSQTRDLVVIGCSAGGVEALPNLLASLPKTLPAAVGVVQHMSANNTTHLVEILNRASPMPVQWAEQGTPVEHGHVYVAPLDVHMLFADRHIALVRGPRENYSRPSINKTFRSAAAHYTQRVIGVLMTGMLDDGVSGLRSIRESGGMTIVQDPADAMYPELPARALQSLRPHHLLPLSSIGPTIVNLVGKPVEDQQPSLQLATEAEMDRVGQVTPSTLERVADRTPIPCPDCKGPTWLIGEASNRRYRCYHGHVTTAQQLLARETAEIESALWSAVRALSDRALTLETLAADSDRMGRTRVADTYGQRAIQAREQAELVRKFVLDVLRLDIPPEEAA